MRLVLVLVVCVASGCEGPQCEVQADLVDGEAWRFVPPEEDTMWPAPEGAAVCEEEAIQIQPLGDDIAVEIDTRFGCGWATVEQTINADINVGDELQVRVFYFSQATFPEAQAQVAIAIDDDVIMDERVDIPTSSGLLAPRIVIDKAYPRGAVARFHIGNHGDNSWNLVELSRVEVAACPP